jgi:hypothetical protein
MPSPTARRCSAAAIALAAAGAAQAAPAPHALSLRPVATAQGNRIVLEELAVPEPGSVGAFKLVAQWVVGKAPRPGQHMIVSRAQLQAVLGPSWLVRGAAAASVSRASQEITAQRLCQVASEAAELRLNEMGASFQHQVNCRAALSAPIVAPAGNIQLRPDVALWRPSNGLQSMPLDLIVDGRMERQVRVGLDVRLSAWQWCAVEPEAEGTPLADARLRRCLQVPPGPDKLVAADAPLPAGRLRRALSAGQALVTLDIAAPDAALAGDPVDVHYRNGAFELEAPGELEQDARVGQEVRVRVSQASRPAIGRLVAPHIVELESQP